MSRDEVEALLTRKYESGEIGSGLYKTGLQYVVMESNDGRLSFQWFQDAADIGDLI